MSLKDTLTNSLLMFVAATCVVLMVKALPQTPPAPQVVPSTSAAPGGAAALAAGGSPTPAIQDGVKVYYLHGNTRCPTCRTIEAYTQEAVQTGFADELRSGRVTWQVINYESPGNEHYATDYDVVAPNVVLAMFKDGKQVKWKGLPEVWEHVGDKAAFLTLVQTSLREFLGQPQAAPSTAPAPVASSTVPPPVPADTVPSPVAPFMLPSAAEPSTATNPIRSPVEPAQPSLPLPE